MDPADDAYWRLLVRFWGFTKWRGELYAYVTYYARVRGVAHPHPVLVKYRHLTTRDRNGRPAASFHAVPVESVVATAGVFPCPDFANRAHNRFEDEVLYRPPLVTLAGGPGATPSADLLPEVPDPESVRLPAPPRARGQGGGEEVEDDDESDDSTEQSDDSDEIVYEEEND